jgi:signal transduction histidine kinase
MSLIFIKYFSMIICSFYIYLKLLQIIPTKKFFFSLIIFIAFTLPTIYLLRIYIPALSILIIVLLSSFYLFYTFKTSYNLSLTAAIISLGIAYFAFLLSGVLMSIIGYFIFLIKEKYPLYIISVISICIIQFLLTTIPFQFRRFKKGMPFLYDYGSSDIGVYISIALLLTASFLSMGKKADLVFIIPVFFSILFGLTIIFWWKNNTKKRYLEKIKAREIEELQRRIQNNEIQIEQLQKNNEELSKIIHKDNKLIPAMEYAVREYMSTTEHAYANSTIATKGQELLEQLACLTKERAGILTNYEANNKKLVSTDIPSIDTLLTYMSRKARSHEISFDVSLSGSFVQLTKQAMEEADLRTLLADLIDNAIIATKKSPCRNILISLGLNGGWYSIDIFDSGELFKAETLSNIGSKRTTTHAKEGGSGIGLMTTFELIKKCQASFIIEELPDSQLFTKKVSICYDQLGEFRIKTSREEIQKSLPFHSCTMQNSSQKYLYLLQQCSSVYTPVEH